MPYTEAVCEEHNLSGLLPFVDRLFHLRALIETFDGVPRWIEPLTAMEVVGLVVLEDEVNRFEQNEIKQESLKWQNFQSPEKLRLR